MSTPIATLLGRYAAKAPQAGSSALDEAGRRVLDSVGVALAGLDSAPAQAARMYALASGPTPDHGPGAHVWGTSTRATPENAALANGVALRYLDCNDAYFAGGGSHPSDVISGLIAVGQQVGSTGPELLDAVAVAYEVIISLSDSFCVQDYGWDHVNVTAIGAACGVARLLRLETEAARHAVSLTCVPHVAMRRTRHGQLSMWKGAAAADAVRHAIYANSLAQFGMEGPEDVFEGPLGFVEQVLNGKQPDREALKLLEDLEAPSGILDTHIKRWPLGYVAQSGVEAALRLHPEIESLDEVRNVTVTTYDKAVARMVSPEKFAPKTRETADHSMPYVVAAALRDGKVDASSFRPEAFLDQRMHEFLATSLEISVSDRYSDAYPRAFPTSVEVELQDGSQLVDEVWYPLGHSMNRLSEEGLEEKFFEFARTALDECRARDICDTVSALNTAGDLEGLADALAF